jgi:hypothetical protein
MNDVMDNVHLVGNPVILLPPDSVLQDLFLEDVARNMFFAVV